MKLRKRHALLVALCSAVGLPTVAGAAVFGPGYKSCGSFKSQYTIRVEAKGMSCAAAVKVQKEFWNGPRSRKIVVNGGSGAAGYVLLKRYRGYKCTSGSGGGQCKKGSRIAAYTN